MSSKDEAGRPASLKTITFSNKAEDFPEWEIKMMSLAKQKGCMTAFVREIATITFEEYEIGKVKEDTTDTTTGLTVTTERETTKEEKRFYRMRSEAWAMLLNSTTDIALAMIKNLQDTPFEGMKILRKKFVATDIEEDYIELEADFQRKTLVLGEDPDNWFADLEALNIRLAAVNVKYEKDELQMKIHVINNMPEEFSGIKKKFRRALTSTTMEDIKAEISSEHKDLIKEGKITRTQENVLAATHWRRFKGNCKKSLTS
jgi:hypothetical protein